MSVTDEVKKLYKATNDSTINKNYIMSIDGTDYDNTNIIMGSFSITEKLCSSSQLKFGECNASILKVKVVADIGDISDKKIILNQEINDNSIDIGVYNVDSCVLTENKEYREVVAYDNIFLFNMDVSIWYNTLDFPIKIKDMLSSLCSHIGVELAEMTLPTGDKEIEKTISPEELKGITVLKCIAELNAGFFRADSLGKIEFVTIDTSVVDDYLEVKDYITLKTETFTTNTITKVVMRKDEDDIGASAGEGDNAYIIEDNFLLYGSSTDTLKGFAEIIYERVKNISYVPYTAEQIGLPYLRCGSQISYKLTSGESFVGLMLQRTLSGTQGLKDVIKTSGTKLIGSTFGIEADVIKVKNKVNRLKRTLEQTLIEMENLEEGLNSEIKQTANALNVLVKKVATMGDMGVTDIVIMYAISESSTEAPVEEDSDEAPIWSSNPPKWIDGKYIWQKTVTTYNDGNVYESNPICITGATGAPGTDGKDGATGKGISSIVNYYLATASSSGVTTSTSGWTTDVQTITSTKKYLWNYEKITYTDKTSDTTVPAIIGVYGNTGADGKDGQAGADGKGIKSITEYYLASASSSGVTTTTSGWTTTIQTTTTSKKYLWNYELITYTDGSTSTTTVRIIGTHGATGSKGATGENGADGKGIESITEYYLASASSSGVTTSTSGWTTAMQTTTTSKKYLWNYELITYTDGSTSTTTVRIIGTHGATGSKGATGENGADGKGIKSITEYYLASASSSGVTISTSGWTTTMQTTTTSKKYLWNYELITYTDGSTSTTTVRIIGTHGDTGAKGETGADGLTIKSIVPQYYVSTSKTSLTGGSWSSTTPTWTKGKYVWSRSKITYSDNTTSYSTAVCDASWEVANNIEAKLELKVDKDRLVSELNAAADVIKLLANRLIIESSYFKLGADGKAELAGGKIGSWNIEEALSSEAEAYVEPGEYERDRIYEYSLGNATLTSNELKYLDLNSDGRVNYKDILLIQKILLGLSDYTGYVGAAKSVVKVQLNPVNPGKLIDMSATTPWGVKKETYLGINGLKCPKVISDAVSATTIETAAGTNLDSIGNSLAELNKTSFGTGVNITEYTSNNPYIAPSDGYIRVNSWGSYSRTYYINNISGEIPSNSQIFIYIKKGFKIYGGGGKENTNVMYYPLA